MITFNMYKYRSSQPNDITRYYAIKVCNDHSAFAYVELDPSSANIITATLPVTTPLINIDVRNLFPRIRLLKTDIAERIFKNMHNDFEKMMNRTSIRRGVDIIYDDNVLVNMMGPQANTLSRELNQLLRSIEENDYYDSKE